MSTVEEEIQSSIIIEEERMQAPIDIEEGEVVIGGSGHLGQVLGAAEHGGDGLGKLPFAHGGGELGELPFAGGDGLGA